MTDGSTATSAKEIQSSTVSSVILEPMDRDCLGNMIVEPMDKVVLDSNLIDKVVLDSTSPGNTPTPTGCASPRPMMEVVTCSHISSISTIFILLQSLQNGHLYNLIIITIIITIIQDEEEEEIRPVLQEAWAPLQQMVIT